MLTLMAEFESDLVRARTREGMAEAKKASRLKDKQPKLSVLQRKRLLADYESGEYTAAQLCEISGLSRSAMDATLRRAREEAPLDRACCSYDLSEGVAWSFETDMTVTPG